MLSNKELSILSDALLHLMASTNEAQKMVADSAAIGAMKRANLEYKRLNDKICNITNLECTYDRITKRDEDGRAVIDNTNACVGGGLVERLCAFEDREELSKRFADSFDTCAWAASICDLFEEVLHRHNILVPDADRKGEDGEACLYGETYQNLVDQVAIRLGLFLTQACS